MDSNKHKKVAYEHIINGKSKVDAYKSAYDVPPNLTSKQLADRANRVFSSKAVKAEIDKLIEDCKDSEIITRDDLLNGLKELHDVAKENAYVSTVGDNGETVRVLVPKAAEIYVKVVDRIALMIGADAPKEIKNDIKFHVDEEMAKYGN